MQQQKKNKKQKNRKDQKSKGKAVIDGGEVGL